MVLQLTLNVDKKCALVILQFVEDIRVFLQKDYGLLDLHILRMVTSSVDSVEVCRPGFDVISLV